MKKCLIIMALFIYTQSLHAAKTEQEVKKHGSSWILSAGKCMYKTVWSNPPRRFAFLGGTPSIIGGTYAGITQQDLIPGFAVILMGAVLTKIAYDYNYHNQLESTEEHHLDQLEMGDIENHEDEIPTDSIQNYLDRDDLTIERKQELLLEYLAQNNRCSDPQSVVGFIFEHFSERKLRFLITKAESLYGATHDQWAEKAGLDLFIGKDKDERRELLIEKLSESRLFKKKIGASDLDEKTQRIVNQVLQEHPEATYKEAFRQSLTLAGQN